ncbi:hypothetical protein TrLO_g6743 [Triparma laevis f. longispina]|uniref:Phosphodiesterase n=1 Tax=Triparma laevis f. longispina TaxID=1714387 RepID=A0A9W7FDP1_9STRA|nr:hypothetical protein TrLO_g6743 [Triparma laevis f. longispina]
MSNEKETPEAPPNARQGRRLSVTMLGGRDIKGGGSGPDNTVSAKSVINKPLAGVGVVSRRRSIVSATETFDREVLNKLTDKPSSKIAKAIQTPLSQCVQLLGEIMHMDDLPIAVHDSVEKVLQMLGEPESLLIVKLPDSDKGKATIGMDEASKKWFEEFLANAPEIDDKSETSSVAGSEGDQSPKAGNRVGDGDGDDGEDFSKTGESLGGTQKGTISTARRRRQMKAAMSDIAPSQIAKEEDEDEDDDDFELEPGEGEAETKKSSSARWSLVKSTMTPLMRWIAQGSKRRKKKNRLGNNEESFNESGRVSTSSSIVSRHKSDVHRKSLLDLTEKKSVRVDGDGKSPQCLEIAIPVIQGMQDDTVEPVQKFFEQQHFDAWHFDVFELHRITNNHSLWFIGMILFEHYKVIDIFQINTTHLSNFLLYLEENYCHDKGAPNPYHNSIHAADVLQTTAHFCTTGPVQKRLRVIHGFALFIAAMGHDYRHPGKTNAFLIHTQDDIAITYNDMSVLENFHAAELFKVLRENNTNILSGMDRQELRTFRSMVVKTILATDLAQGFEYVGLFKGHVQTGHAFESEESKQLLMAMIMKVADVSHPCKQWHVHFNWSELISEEFFIQGDLEIKEGMPISPLCDRTTHFLPKSQLDFIDFVVRPSVEVFSEYCSSEASVWVNTMNDNYGKWKAMYELEKLKRKATKASQVTPG